MNRRNFMKSASFGGAAALVGPSLLTMEGCDISTLKSYLNVVLESAEKILALSASTDTWYTDLTAAITALEATESNWSGTTAVAAVISALDTVEAVLAVIPVTEVYSPLIDLLVSAIETILTTFVSKTAPARIPKAMAIANPHRGRVPLCDPHFLQSKVGAYKNQWDGLATDLGLSKAKL
jgi:hypothetical protein